MSDKPLRTPKFDWDEARRLRAEGLTQAAIAAQLGVTIRAIQRVCTPGALERSRVYAQRSGVVRNPSFRTLCECGREFRWFQHSCRLCANEAQATSVRPDVLRCSRCREWKPDQAFSFNRTRVARRSRHDWCLECDKLAKREYRRRRKAAA